MIDAPSHGRELPSFDSLDNEDDVPIIKLETETIDLNVMVEELKCPEVSDFRHVPDTTFGKLLQSMPVPSLLIDQSCSIIFVNQSWERINTAYPNILGRPFSSLFPNRSVAQEANTLVENVFVSRKGILPGALLEIEKTIIWGRVHFRALRMGNGEAILALVEDLSAERRQLLLTERHKREILKSRDELDQRVKERTADLNRINEKLLKEISHRRQVEKTLHASQASFSSVVEKTNEGIAVLDVEGTVLYANPAAKILLSRPEGIAGTRFEFEIAPGSAVEKEGVRPSGEMSVLEFRAEETDWQGNPALLVSIRDITERKMVELEQLKTQKLESLELIAGGIIHDFNNLLTGNLANISLAKLHIPHQGQAYEALNNAQKAVEEAKNLTHKLLTFTKGGPVAPRPTSVKQLLQDNAALAFSGSHVKYQLDVLDDIWPVEIDQSQIGQVMQNLLINAQQATTGAGIVRLKGENLTFPRGGAKGASSLKHGKYVKISVEDNGCGIPPQELSRIFDPYFTTKPHGTGLGLTTAYSIVRKHGGHLRVRSRVGVGTTFFIYLPASEKQVEIPVSDSGENPVFGSGRVLVMDDDETIRTVSNDLLSFLGYEVETVKDGLEAIQAYGSAMESDRPFSAVIMDLTILDGMGGREAIGRLLQIDPQIRAIVSSGHLTDPAMSNYQECGFCGIVRKPYTATELSRALHLAINEPGNGS
jgi:signal transduction histidine kinase/ActR/RegA family two-component response regulator